MPHYPPEKLDLCYACACEEQAIEHLFLLRAIDAVVAKHMGGDPSAFNQLLASLREKAGFRS